QNGALVQKEPAVDATVDGFLENTMNYNVWKDRAIKRNQYLRPLAGAEAGESAFGNSFGQPLYVTPSGVLTTQDEGNQPLSSLNQLSMADKISEASGLVHRTDNQKVDDSFLFVDFLTGNEDSPGAIQEYFLGNGFMYKGILYICGNVKLGDASGNPTVFAK